MTFPISISCNSSAFRVTISPAIASFASSASNSPVMKMSSRGGLVMEGMRRIVRGRLIRSVAMMMMIIMKGLGGRSMGMVMMRDLEGRSMVMEMMMKVGAARNM
ncbi:hypothetical protein M5689_019018 [Euphorbia peplus]|nr:hypothetical protein M5689_019018 [Euphorbia peplus]